MADYTQPKDVEKRLRYFNGQFLREQDFIDEQHYHLDRQRRHQRQFHAPGIAEGLTVTAPASGSTVTVAPGTAIDPRGQTLVLAASETVSVTNVPSSSRRLVIGYRALESDVAETGSTSYTRWHERPQLAVIELDEALADRVVLARLNVSSSGAVSVDLSERQYAGVLLPGGPTLRTGTGGRIDSSAGLRVTGDTELTGNLGLGTNPAAQGVKLALANTSGGILVDSGTSNSLALRLTSSGTGWGSGLVLENKTATTGRSYGIYAGSDGSLHLSDQASNNDRLVLTAQGNVGIGTTTPATRLEVVGNWANDEGALRITGDKPTIRLQGGAASGSESWLLHVSGNGPGNFEIHRRTGTSWTPQLSLSTAGHLGLGTFSPSARLSIVASGASELTGTIRSTTLLTSSGALGATVGNELALASLGFTAGNQSSLGIRAQRVSAGSDWTSTAIGLGMDVDATVRSGATLWLHANKNVGIGTATPAKPLHIQQSATYPIPVINETIRPGLAINGDYPELTLFSGFNNTSHGATIRLGAYNDDTRQTYKHWVIGTAGRNATFLDFGFGANDANPHVGIRGYNGRTVMTMLENGNVGIGTGAPAERLQVNDGNLQVRHFPANDTTPDLASLQIVNRGPGGAESKWVLFTAAVGGGWGVNPNAFEIWHYPGGGSRFQIRNDGNTLLVPNGGSVGIGWAPDTKFRLDVAGSIKMSDQSQIYSSGRLHIHGEELLYLLNKHGVVVGKSWGGNGNLHVEGRLGVYGQSPDPRHNWDGGIHTWDLEAEGSIWSAHDVLAKGTFRGNYSDLAENYISEQALEPGDVVCFASNSDLIVRSERPNDLTVCGIISTKPGMLLNSDIDNPDERLFPVALSGRVPCKVTDQNGPIRHGDLLTSSSTPGHAMKARPIEIDGQALFRPGTIIGKALGSHTSGAGVIDVFVSHS